MSKSLKSLQASVLALFFLSGQLYLTIDTSDLPDILALSKKLCALEHIAEIPLETTHSEFVSQLRPALLIPVISFQVFRTLLVINNDQNILKKNPSNFTSNTFSKVILRI